MSTENFEALKAAGMEAAGRFGLTGSAAENFAVGYTQGIRAAGANPAAHTAAPPPSLEKAEIAAADARRRLEEIRADAYARWGGAAPEQARVAGNDVLAQFRGGARG